MGSPDPMGGLKDLSHLHILTLLAHARDVAKTSQEVIYGLIQSTPAQWIENGRVFLHNVLRALKDSTSLFWEVLYRHDTGECSHRPLNQMWISINGERTTRRCKVCARPTTKKCQGLHNKRCCARYCGKEHQLLDWPVHKIFCLGIDREPCSTTLTATSTTTCSSSSSMTDTSSSTSTVGNCSPTKHIS
jgi:hypothetical protein